MHSKRFATQLALAVIAVAALLGPAWAQTLVQNGNFEGLPGGTYGAGAVIGPWYVTQANIDMGAGDLAGPAYDGVMHVDLNGYSGAGGIAQDIIVPAAGSYRLQFAMSANPWSQPMAVRQMRVSLGSVYSAVFTFDPTTHPGHGWYSVKWDLHTVDIDLPGAGLYTLAFTSLTPDPWDAGPLLDAVSLEPVSVIPESSTALLLTAGLPSLLTLRRRKR